MTEMQDTLEGKVSATESESVNVKVQWKNIKKCVLDIIHGMIWRVDGKARKPCITTEMTNKTDERRKWKNVNNEELQKTKDRQGQEGVS
jgi:hypothetical protein